MKIEKTFAIEFEQSGIRFWSCTLKYKHLVEITYVATRAASRDLLTPSEEGAVQRLLNKRRIKSIKDFVLEGGMFPNGIILNWTSSKLFKFNQLVSRICFRDARFSPKNGHLELINCHL